MLPSASVLFGKQKQVAPLFASTVDAREMSSSSDFLGNFDGLYDSNPSASASNVLRDPAESLEEQDNPFITSHPPDREIDVDLSSNDSDSSRPSNQLPGSQPAEKPRIIHIEHGEVPARQNRLHKSHKEVARDAPWLAIYLSCVAATLMIAFWAYFLANPPYQLTRAAVPAQPALTSQHIPLPTFTPVHQAPIDDDAEPWPAEANQPLLDIMNLASPTMTPVLTERASGSTLDNEVEEAASLLSVLPLLTSLTLFSILGTTTAIYFLSQFVRRMIYGLLVLGPVSLVSVAFWGFGSSFTTALSSGGTEARWACLAAILIAGLSARMIYVRVHRLDKTIQVVELATLALVAHPALAVVQGALLLAHLIITLPFFGIFVRLLLLHSTNPGRPVLSMALFVMGTYFWSLALIRNMSRLTAAIVLSNWYFTRHEPNPSFRTSQELVKAAWEQTRGPQLGTIALASLLTTIVSCSTFVLVRARRWLKPSNGLLPPALAILYHLSPVVLFLSGIVEGISTYALIWSGITGESFWTSARKSGQLIKSNGLSRTADYLLVQLILTLLSLSFSILAGLLGLLTVSSSAVPWRAITTTHHAFSIILSFCIPYYSVRLITDILSNAVDCLFICFNVDLDRNENHCTKALEAFTTTRLEEEEEDSVV